PGPDQEEEVPVGHREPNAGRGQPAPEARRRRVLMEPQADELEAGPSRDGGRHGTARSPGVESNQMACSISSETSPRAVGRRKPGRTMTSTSSRNSPSTRSHSTISPRRRSTMNNPSFGPVPAEARISSRGSPEYRPPSRNLEEPTTA